MDIGIVIVTYNRLEKLKYALQCYSNQTRKPKYIIIVNNCSTDNTLDYLEEWGNKKEPFEKYIINLQSNEGGAGGFYHGMEAASELGNEWIWLADDDAFPRVDALEILGNYYENLPETEKSTIAAICPAVYDHEQISLRDRVRVYTTFFKVVFKRPALDEYENESFDFNMLSYVGACLRKTVLQKVGFDKKEYFIYCDDSEHSLRMNKMGKFVCVTGSIVDHNTDDSEADISWKLYYAKRNDLLMIREHYPIRYFILRFIRRFMADVSIFSSNPYELKKMYLVAYKDALFNKTGIHKIYHPGWEP